MEDKEHIGNVLEEIYDVYDLWTSKHAYFSTKDAAECFIQQENNKEPIPFDELPPARRGRYDLYRHLMNTGAWE